MLLEYLAEVVYVGKPAFDRDFLHFIHPAVEHAFGLVEPYQRQVLPERLSGLLFEEVSEVKRAEIDHLRHFCHGKRFKVMLYHMLEHLFYTFVIVPLVIAVADKLVEPMQDQHENRSRFRHVARVAYEPCRIQFLVKGDYILPYTDMRHCLERKYHFPAGKVINIPVDAVAIHQVVGDRDRRLAAALPDADEITCAHRVANAVNSVFSLPRDDVCQVDKTVETLFYDPRRRTYPVVVIMYIDYYIIEFLFGHTDHHNLIISSYK